MLAGATLEVFHADDRGEYDMRGFRCRGEIPVGANGEYGYETVVPAGYGGRPEHIHYVINAPGHKRLVTQLYFENDPKFKGDPDKNYDNLVSHRELVRPVRSINRNNTAYTSVIFDICLEKA
jgi:protocatechuate 3,4-dioxygenase beta subunit